MTRFHLILTLLRFPFQGYLSSNLTPWIAVTMSFEKKIEKRTKRSVVWCRTPLRVRLSIPRQKGKVIVTCPTQTNILNHTHLTDPPFPLTTENSTHLSVKYSEVACIRALFCHSPRSGWPTRQLRNHDNVIKINHMQQGDLMPRESRTTASHLQSFPCQR